MKTMLIAASIAMSALAMTPALALASGTGVDAGPNWGQDSAHRDGRVNTPSTGAGLDSRPQWGNAPSTTPRVNTPDCNCYRDHAPSWGN